MVKSMRKPTLQTIGLGNVIDIFKSGKMPADASELVDKIFGNESSRGSLVISGANGIVGAGKMMQLGSRLNSFGVPVIGLDFPGAPDGIGKQYQGLAGSMGKNKADEIMSNFIRLNYNGKSIPEHLNKFNPKLLIEAIPEILEVKKAHFELFKKNFPELEIRSVTSGFPSSELGVGIAHPAFPHQINKIWEIVENEPSDVTKLLWALGLIPMPVSDNWSFVLDVLFCGLTLCGVRYHQATNTPFWKIDKYIRKKLGPNPFRAHDVIGAKGANFLSWTCLHHLSLHYGQVFEPGAVFTEHKDSGLNWYPMNHLRPAVNWQLNDEETDHFETMILGPLFQMTSLLLHEHRAHLSFINSIGEICAQFRNGVLSEARKMGSAKVVETVEKYHRLEPASAQSAWFPEAFADIGSTEWQQLYVNAEHDGNIGVITLGRESYSHEVDAELNRAIDWLKNEKIEKVILTGDFHLSTQLVGADTNDFFPSLTSEENGFRLSYEWSKTARRLNYEFKTSVGFINGKRCLGGMLELMLHCHYLVALSDSDLGAPEVNLPVVPGMEMCHWPFRKCGVSQRDKLMTMLLGGKFVKARETVGWLTDFSGSMNECLRMTRELADSGEGVMPKRKLAEGSIEIPLPDNGNIPFTENQSLISARKAIYDCIADSCSTDISNALRVQSEHSAKFMCSKLCMSGVVGTEYTKTVNV